MRKFLSVNPLKRLPARQTKYSAGYDFYLPELVRIKKRQTIVIDTYIKVEMNPDEYLIIVPRSSTYKKKIELANSIGIIDADYHNTIKLHIKNIGKKTIVLEKDDRIVQGIFHKYLTIDSEIPIENDRQ